MSHLEKIEIFNQYAVNQGYSDWDHLQNDYELLLMTVDEFQYFMFEACDLVQEQQQKRIADNAELKEIQCHIGTEYEVDKSSVINPENLIK